jgi:energy-coupling factor transporter ATP-binding protein EcfA2
MERILITGSPKSGKSTLVKKMNLSIHYCTDPQRMCDHDVTGTPDHLQWSETSQFVADNWIGKKQIIEGVAIPRALRKWKESNPYSEVPFDKLIILEGTFEPLTKGQLTMAKGIKTVMEDLLFSWPEIIDKIEFVNLTKQ